MKRRGAGGVGDQAGETAPASLAAPATDAPDEPETQKHEGDRRPASAGAKARSRAALPAGLATHRQPVVFLSGPRSGKSLQNGILPS